MKAAANELLFLVWVSAFLAVAWRIALRRHARAKRISGANVYRADDDLPFQLATVVAAVAVGACVYLASHLVASVL